MHSFSGIRAAIVDLDGTLVDTAPDFHVAVNRMRAELDLPPVDLATITGFIGKGSEHLIRCILRLDYPADQAEAHFDAALQSYLQHYLAMNGDYSSIYPGVTEGLDQMRRNGLRLACVTNKPYALARDLLEKTGLAGFFECVYGGDSLPKKKPDPYPMLKVCDDFDLAPAQVVAIGDSSNDAQAARAAGCKVLTVPYGYNHGHAIQEIDSDGIVPTLLDAARVLSA